MTGVIFRSWRGANLDWCYFQQLGNDGCYFQELELEQELQQLATELAPLYQRVAPAAYRNQVSPNRTVNVSIPRYQNRDVGST